MDSRDLTADQIKVIQERVRPMLTYLAALRKRMEQKGFGDKLMDTVSKAHDAVHHLSTALHYLHVDRQRDEKETRPWY